MCRRYMPKTNCPSRAMTRTNHSPCDGNVTGSGAPAAPALDRTLTKRTTSGGEGSVTNGFSVAIRTRSRSLQTTTCVSNGSFWRSAARNFAFDPGLRTTNVPAAPTFTTSKPLNSRARTLGRKVRCPPTLTPRRKTTRAMRGIVKESLYLDAPIDVLRSSLPLNVVIRGIRTTTGAARYSKYQGFTGGGNDGHQ